MNSNILLKLEQEPKRWKTQLLVLLVIVAVLTWSASGIEYKGISEKGPAMALNILNGLIHPDLSMLFGLGKNDVPFLILETLAIAFLGTVFGTILSTPLAFLSARNVTIRPVNILMNLLIMLIRTIPAFVYGLMFIRVTGPGAFAGVLTMSFTSLGMLTKRNTEVVEDISTGVLESLDASGCTSFQKIRYGIIPQLYANFVSNTIYRFDINMKDATILGLVGAGGIGTPLVIAMQNYKWNEVGALLIGLMVIILIIDYLSSRIRVKLARG